MWNFLESTLHAHLAENLHAPFDKQNIKHKMCRAVAIIGDIKLMENDNDMRLRAFVCYGLNTKHMHQWIQVTNIKFRVNGL